MNTDEDPNRYNANALSNIVTLNYAMLKSPHNTTLPKDAPVKELKFTLTGNMNRYVWSMDNKVLAESDKIPVKKGEILRITIHNNSMMRHPIHLHGFDFRVLNEHGENAPMKNIIDIMPMETDTIEFLANTEGDWFFHCHILYHMMAGMNRVFAVDDYKNPELPNKEKAYKMLERLCHQRYRRGSYADERPLQFGYRMAFRLQRYARLRSRNPFRTLHR